MDSDFLCYPLVFVIYLGSTYRNSYTMVGSHPSVFKRAVSVLLSLIPSPGELSGDFFWPSSRRAKWNWLIITALQFLLRTNQFVSLVGNSVTLLMQGFDSPLPFGTQYKPSILLLKEKKTKGFSGGFCSSLPLLTRDWGCCSHWGSGRRVVYTWTVDGYSDSADLLWYRDLNILVTPFPTVLQWFPKGIGLRRQVIGTSHLPQAMCETLAPHSSATTRGRSSFWVELWPSWPHPPAPKVHTSPSLKQRNKQDQCIINNNQMVTTKNEGQQSTTSYVELDSKHPWFKHEEDSLYIKSDHTLENPNNLAHEKSNLNFENNSLLLKNFTCMRKP